MEENKIYIESDYEAQINKSRSEIIGICAALVFMFIILFNNVVNVESILLKFVSVILAALVVYLAAFTVVRIVLFISNMIKKNGLQKIMKTKL